MANVLPPFTAATAHTKVKAAQALWNTRFRPSPSLPPPIANSRDRDPRRVSQAYTPMSVWRNRDTFLRGSDQIVAFLTDKWLRERDYRLRKELFAFQENKIAVQFWYEFRDASGQWWRCYGLEDWTFAADGKMEKRFAFSPLIAHREGELMQGRMMSANDVRIAEDERWFKDGVDVDSVQIGEEHW